LRESSASSALKSFRWARQALRARLGFSRYFLAPFPDKAGGARVEVALQLIGADVDENPGEGRHAQEEHPADTGGAIHGEPVDRPRQDIREAYHCMAGAPELHHKRRQSR